MDKLACGVNQYLPANWEFCPKYFTNGRGLDMFGSPKGTGTLPPSS